MMLVQDNNTFQKTLCREATDQQSYSYTNHPRSLRNTILYRQASRLKQFAAQLQNKIRTVLTFNISF